MEHVDRFDGAHGALTGQIIAALIEVHRALGPGLLESAYTACIAAELHARGLPYQRERPISIDYKGVAVECGYRIDFIVAGQALIEVKAVERILRIHEAQVVTYLRLARLPVGLLVNFNEITLRNGLRRLTPEHPSSRRPSAPCDPLWDSHGEREDGS